eukprot:gene18333-21375_t
MTHLLGMRIPLLSRDIGRKVMTFGPHRSFLRSYRVNKGGDERVAGRIPTVKERAESVKKEPGILSQMARNAIVAVGGPILSKVLGGGVVVLAVYGLYIYAISSIKAQASEALDSVTQSVKSAKDSIVQKAGEVVDRVREGGNSVIEGGKRAADSVSSTVSNGASSVIEGGKRAADSVSSTVSNGIEKTKEGVSSVKDKIEGAVEGLHQSSSGVFESVREKAETVKDVIKETITRDKRDNHDTGKSKEEENDHNTNRVVKEKENEEKFVDNNTISAEGRKRSEVAKDWLKKKVERFKGSNEKDKDQ